MSSGQQPPRSWEDSVHDRPPYAVTLRVLGSVLDREGGGRFAILETPTGFTMVTDGASGDWQRRERTLTFGDAIGMHRELEGRRSSIFGVFKSKPVHTEWELVDERRENALFALGRELDEASAAALLLDETEDGLLMSFSYIDATDSYVWHKKMLFLTRDDIREIVGTHREA